MQERPSSHVLPITGLEIPEIDLEGPLADVELKHYQYFQEAYFKAAKDAILPADGALFQSLGILCAFCPQYGNRAEPYRASIIAGTMRSSIPDDLSESDVDTIEKLLTLAKDFALRARLADILWIRRKKGNHPIIRAAIEDYLAAAQQLIRPNHWVLSVEMFHRAIQLAGALGREKMEFERAKTALLAIPDHPLAETELFLAHHFLRLIYSLGIGEAKHMADVAKRHAEIALSPLDPERRRDYLLLEADFRKVQGAVEEEAEARLKAAETYVEEAEQCVKQAPPSYFAASSLLSKGIVALRDSLAPLSQIKALRERLKIYQKQALAEMRAFRMTESEVYHIGIDLSKAKESSARYVASPDFRRSMILLALGMDVVDVVKLRTDVIEMINKAPFLGLLNESMVDEAGRVVAHKESLLGLSGDKAEKELETHMFEHARNFDWRSRAQAFIEPARIQVWRQHRPRLVDLDYLVRDNPFIPPEHEPIFLQGLFYGLAGDFVIASHLLAPQIENSIRYVLEQNGADVSNLNSDLTQQVKTLGALFEMEEATRIFGRNLCFELRGLLKEKHGFSFRNDIAHGFATQGECFGPGALNTWWIALKLCHCTMILPDDLAED